MTGSAIQYHPETIPAFKGIPTIECLPPRVSTTEIIKELADCRPNYHETDRDRSPEDRGMLVQVSVRTPACKKVLDICTGPGSVLLGASRGIHCQPCI